jgi:cytoskeletal protein CcmA (bactofilin family)
MDRMVEIPDTRANRGRGTSNGASDGSNVVLGPRDSLTGTLIVEGNVRILGSVEGEIRATGDIDIDSQATVQARIEGRSVHVRGELTGDVVAFGRFTVGGSGTVNGNVRAPRLQVDDGATVNGNVTMAPAEKTSSRDSRDSGDTSS